LKEAKVFGWQDYWFERERRYDEIEQAKQERLVRRVLESKGGSAGRLQSWVAHLGAWLISAGSYLQTRYVAEAR
jgi:hypothetical protein